MSHAPLYQEIVVYKGDEIVANGRLKDCAAQLGIKPDSLYFYLMPAYQRRLDRRKTERSEGRRMVVRV